MNSAEGFALIITLWRHKKSLKLVYAKTLSAKTLKLVLAINSNLKVVCSPSPPLAHKKYESVAAITRVGAKSV